MATIRIAKNKNFSIVSNELLRDKRLSLRTRGLLVFCLSLSDEWEYSVRGLSYATGESEGKIALCLKELEKHGYLTRARVRNEKGQLEGTVYTLWEQPQNHNEKKPIVENPILDNPVQEKPILENRGQINTISNNNKYIYNKQTKETQTDKTRAREEAPALQPIPFTPPAELDRQRRSAETGNPPLKPEEEKIALEWFGRFWKAYPKKQGQVEARLAWMRMRFDVQLYTEIVEAVQRFRAVRRDWQTAAGRYVPMPANFLMNERWKDEVAAEPPVDFDKPMDIASMAAMIVAEGEKQNADREGYYGRAGDMEGRGAYPAEGGEPGRIPDDDTVDVEPVWSV